MNDLQQGNNPVRVSVHMPAYNHERYIAQALDSALMQRTNFDYEIVIGEDCWAETVVAARAVPRNALARAEVGRRTPRLLASMLAG